MCSLTSLLPWPLLQCSRPAFSKSPSLTFPASTDLSLTPLSETPIVLYILQDFVCLVEHFTVSVTVLLLPLHMLCFSKKPFWKTFSPPGHPYLSFDTQFRNCYLRKPFLCTPGWVSASKRSYSTLCTHISIADTKQVFKETNAKWVSKGARE